MTDHATILQANADTLRALSIGFRTTLDHEMVKENPSLGLILIGMSLGFIEASYSVIATIEKERERPASDAGASDTRARTDEPR
jgi:hypothetical protein